MARIGGKEKCIQSLGLETTWKTKMQILRWW